MKVRELESRLANERDELDEKISHVADINANQRQQYEQLSQRCEFLVVRVGWRSFACDFSFFSYNKLGGHYERTSAEMRDEQIALPQTLAELQFECLRLREALIEARAGREHADQEHASEYEILNSEYEKAQVGDDAIEDL